MSSRQRRYEKLNKIVGRLSREISGGVAVIVEGVNDRIALRRIGLNGKISLFKSSRMKLEDFVCQIDSQRAIVLTDFDKEGQELAGRLMQELEHQGISVNNAIRKELAALIKPEIAKIEELASLIFRMRSEFSERHDLT